MASLQSSTIRTPRAPQAWSDRVGRARRALSCRDGGRWLDALLLGASVLVFTAVYAHFALRVATFQLDESLYTHQARLVAEYFPQPILRSEIFQRGLQRLDQLLLAVPFTFLRGPSAFQADRVIQCLLFASAAVPAFLLARGSGLGRLASLFAGVLAIVVPWAVISTSFLTECAAYPAYAWTLYAVWAAITQPSLAREALAGLAILVAALSRSEMVALAPLLPLAALWQELRWEMAGKPVTTRAQQLPGRLARRHPLVSAVTVAGTAVYLAARIGILPTLLNTLTGEYGVPSVGPIGQLIERYEYFLSRAAVGTGLIPLAVGVPWLVGTLIRPRDGRQHALAVVCLLGLFCILLTLIPAGPDERYTAYLAVPIAVLFVNGLRTKPGLGVLAGAVGVDLLIESVTWPALANLYDYFTYPAAIFYQRVIWGHASIISLPLIHLSPERIVQIVVLAVAFAWLIAGRLKRSALPAAVLIGFGVLTLGALQTFYAMHKFATTAGVGPDAAAESWVDRHVPASASVAVIPVSLGLSLNFTPIWETVEMWNASVNSTAFFESPAPGTPLDNGRAPLPVGATVFYLSVNPKSGLLNISESGARKALRLHYVLVPEISSMTVGFDAETSQLDPVLLVRLERLRQPGRLDWVLYGTSEEGFITPGAPAEATIFDSALSRGERCASFRLALPPGITKRWSFKVTSNGRIVSDGRLTAMRPTAITVPLSVERQSGWPIAHLRIRTAGSAPYPGGTTVSARVEDFALEPCKQRQRR